ncbi:hypothetical protein ACE2AJ_04120 [Aquihabitans daechungensis]|uniref:hypothetical protein n=1 Tax=Aquihabitans daechungensis TaxID=1052257 RepID=UPI003BA37569
MRTRFDALDRNTTERPSPEMAGASDEPLEAAPPGVALALMIDVFARSRTKTSSGVPTPPGPRFTVNATWVPSSLIDAAHAVPPIGWPSAPTDARVSAPVAVTFTKMS